MGTGYTRNDTGNNIADGNVINASDLDGEYNAIEAAFNASTGHTHDGTSAEGAPIEVAGPAQDIVITATEVRPKTDNTLDIGTTTLEFKDAFFDGTVKTDTLTVDENATVTGNLTVNGNTTLGNAATDTVTVTADVASDLIPSADGTYDLGASGSEWQDLYVDGTANIDSLVADTADINAGSIDGITLGTNSAVTSAVITTADINGGTIDDTTIGGSTPAAGSFTTVTGSGDMNIDSGTLFVDASADSVGIGTTSPSAKLHVEGSSAVIKLLESGGSEMRMAVTGSASYLGTYVADPLIFTTNSSEAMRIDSSGNVGIGDTTPSYPLDVVGIIGSTSYFRSSDSYTVFTGADVLGSTGGITSIGANPIVIGTDGTERMRIDSSGNVLFSTTTSPDTVVGATGAGMAYEANGFLGIARVGTNIILNRRTTDGDIILFKKDGSEVGSIGVQSDDRLTIGCNDIGIGFVQDGDSISPWNDSTKSYVDNKIDIGDSSNRFKDLYLSGGVYLGGTVAANYLDDYEEGTWTPVITGSTTAGTVGYDNQIGKYTKIGNIVTVSCIVDTGIVTVAPTGDLRVSGLPFNPGSSNEFVGAVVMRGIPFPASTTTVSVISRISQSSVEFQASGDNVNAARVQADNLATDDYIYFTLTYRV